MGGMPGQRAAYLRARERYRTAEEARLAAWAAVTQKRTAPAIARARALALAADQERDQAWMLLQAAAEQVGETARR